MSILDDTLELLLRKKTENDLGVRHLFLTNYFTIIQLTNGFVGAAMGYYSLPSGEVDGVMDDIKDRQKNDPLLVHYFFKEYTSGNLSASIRTALVSALSAPVINEFGDAHFVVSEDRPFDPFQKMRSVLIVGFGGCLNFAIDHPDVMDIHVMDFCYAEAANRNDLATKIFMHQRNHPFKSISISDGSDFKEQIKIKDVFVITGSALCNDTMDSLLEQGRHCKRIIVQGQSASIHPKALFDRGVDMVITTIKPDGLISLVKKGRERSMLENGLPYIYLTPQGF